MASLHREKEYEAVLVSLGSEFFTSLLRKLQREFTHFPRCDSWREVVAVMRVGNSDDAIKDVVTLSILTAHREDRNPLWLTPLLAIYWPALTSVFRVYYAHSTCDDECWGRPKTDLPQGLKEDLWQNIVLAFYEVAQRIDVQRRGHRLASKLFNDVLHQVKAFYRRKRDLESWPFSESPEEVIDRFQRRAAWETEATEGSSSDDVFRSLHVRFRTGRITRADFRLLVETEVHGRRLADMAIRGSAEYERLKKRRQRLRARKLC